MDDLLIYSPDTTTHTEQTKRVLQRMVELDLHLKLEKCTFATTTVEYLGMIVKPGQLAMDPVKLNSIVQWPTPSKVKDVRSFLGFANFYCRFIPNYSTLACPLIDLTKKNLPWNWTPFQHQALTNSNTFSSHNLSCPYPTSPHLSQSPLMHPNMHQAPSFSKLTQMATGIRVPTSLNPSRQQNEIMIFTTGNS